MMGILRDSNQSPSVSQQWCWSLARGSPVARSIAPRVYPAKQRSLLPQRDVLRTKAGSGVLADELTAVISFWIESSKWTLNRDIYWKCYWLLKGGEWEMGHKMPVATFPFPGVKYWLMNSGLVVAQKGIHLSQAKVWRKMSEIWLCTKEPRLNFDSGMLCDLSEKKLLQLSADPHMFCTAKKKIKIFPKIDISVSPKGFHIAASSLVSLEKLQVRCAGVCNTKLQEQPSLGICNPDHFQGSLLSWRGAILHQQHGPIKALVKSWLKPWQINNFSGLWLQSILSRDAYLAFHFSLESLSSFLSFTLCFQVPPQDYYT